MDKEIDLKLEALQKYLPYIDFIVGIDNEKYAKFVDIKKWIINKKRLPLSDLNKIEQSMITSYKNMTLLNKKIPRDISNIFYAHFKHQFVNLCSDDDDEEEHKDKQERQSNSLTNPRPSCSDSKNLQKIEDDSDDEIEFVSISFRRNSNKSQTGSTATKAAPDNAGKPLNGTSQMLANIDDISWKSYGNPMTESVKPNEYSNKSSNSNKSNAESTDIPPPPSHADASNDGTSPNITQTDGGVRLENNSSEPKKYCALLGNEVDIKDELLFQRRPPKIECNAPDTTNKKSDEIPKSHKSISDTILLDSSDDDYENDCATVKNTKLEANNNKSDVSEYNNNEAEIRFKNLTTEEMLKIISARIPKLDYEQLQGLYRQVPQSASTENHLPPSSIDENCEKNVAPSRISPVLAAPSLEEKEVNKSPEPLIKALFEFLAKIKQPEESHAPNMAPSSVLPFNTTPEQYQQQLHYAKQPQQHINFYNNMPMQTPMCCHAVGITQPMCPQAFPHMNQNAIAPTSQTVSTVPTQLKARDPRAKSLLYQNSLQAIQAEMQKRLNTMQANNFPHSSVQTVLVPSKSQPMVAPATLVAAQQQHQQLYKMSTAIKQPNLSAHQPPYVQKNHNPVSARADITKSSITYGEYKRRKTEEEQKQKDDEKRRKEVEERKNEEQCKLVGRKEVEERKNEEPCMLVGPETNETTCSKDVSSEVEKPRKDIRSILFNILQPYEDKIEKCWKAKTDVEIENTSDESRDEESRNEEKQNLTKEKQKSRINTRMDRLFKEMECTFKGYDKLPGISGGKRRSSIHARSVISEQLNSSQTMDINELCKSVNRGKRRFSLHASQFTDTTDENLQLAGKKRCNSVHSTLNEDVSEKIKFTSPVPTSEPHPSSTLKNKTETTVPESADKCSAQSSDSKTIEFEEIRRSKIKAQLELCFKKQPKVMVKRLSIQQIQRHTKKYKNLLEVQLIESGIRSVKEDSPTAAATKKLPLKRCNNDCIMTERNTKSCALCSTKPADLTNHYKRKHKCESYVSRLTWSELDELYLNTPFAKLISSKNSIMERYEVLCPFCNEKVQMPFRNLYNHYSSHTGEYAFQCTGCQLDKPFRADIQSHQMHSKTCRNSQIQTMYRYQPNAMSIYLHYCTICNFVQLNEANILKHLREHHEPRKATSDNVQKCILAAISDGPESNSAEQVETTDIATSTKELNEGRINGTVMNEIVPEVADPAMTELEIKPSLDDNIPVFNEACTEDLFGLEERLKQMHEGHIKQENIPMTVIHLGSESTPGKVVNKDMIPKNEPTDFKTEDIDVDENILPTSPGISTVPKKPYSKNVVSHSIYREYPANVNYLGFYKCMAGDCFYSSDSAAEFVMHMEGHQEDNLHINSFLCPYCILPSNACQSVNQLVEHCDQHHAHMVYQCSMCCYRSCEASYVLVHQRLNHPSCVEKCVIYKCPGEEARLNYIKENMLEYISKIKCPYCSNSYYNTHILMLHVGKDHNLEVQQNICKYSCVYCSFWDGDQLAVQKHIAIQHPGELPFLVDHNLTTMTEDALHNLEPSIFGDPVPIRQVSGTYDAKSNEMPLLGKPEENIKPSVEELIRCQEELVKVRLRKLTEKTGVPPDCLYRCSDQTCGGFFSVYNLWCRHMRVRHTCLETRCPHCTAETIKSLEEFEFHFESHRLHTYICYHCPHSMANAENAQDHWLKVHSELGHMHVEQIRFNLNYTYHIIVQSNKFQNRMEFVCSLKELLDRRIEELKDNEASKLKHMWFVSNSPFALWLEDLPKNVFSIKLVKKCFHGNCNFRTKCDETLFNHVRKNHEIVGSIFKCSKCDFSLEKCTAWEVALNHIKQHSETSFFICGACSKYFLCRSKISEHIRLEHSARDVPVVNVIKTSRSTHAKVAIVLANECLTFTTMRNCFSCEELSISGNALMLHLKRYHNFVFSYFCEWCNMSISSLLAVEKHFQETHTRNKIKIRCELSSKHDLSVFSINEFKIDIACGLDGVSRQSPVIIKKEEPDDDSVIIMEDDDVIAEKFEKSQNLIDENASKPKLKCIETGTLLDPNASHRLRVLPRIKIVHKQRRPEDYNSKAKTSDTKMQPRNIKDVVISSQRIALPPPFVPHPRDKPASNNIAVNQCESLPRDGSMVNHGNISNFNLPGKNMADLGCVNATSSGGGSSRSHIYNTNSSVQSMANYPSASSIHQNARHCNSVSFNGPTTAFLNSQFILPPTPSNTMTAMTNAHSYQNMIHSSSENMTPNTRFISNISYASNVSNFPVKNINVNRPAVLQNPVVTTLTIHPSNPHMFHTTPIQPQNNAVSTLAASHIPGPPIHTNLNFQSSVSSITNINQTEHAENKFLKLF